MTRLNWRVRRASLAFGQTSDDAHIAAVVETPSTQILRQRRKHCICLFQYDAAA